MIRKLFTSIILIFLSALFSITTFGQTKKTLSIKPGQTFKDCTDCPEMVIIPAGSFMMGSPENEKGRSFNPDAGPIEGPQRVVNIPQFAAGKFDITKAEWAAFVKATNRKTSGGCGFAMLPGDTLQPWQPNPSANWNHIGFAQDSSHPVVCVSWEDTQDYLTWLNKKTGFTYRLLSEAEWEYAARAGTTTPYYWGDSASHDYANYGMDTIYGIGWASGYDKWVGTSPVGSFPPNAFGLYDMSGNVMQWVDDCFSLSYSSLPANSSAYKNKMQLKLTGNINWMNGKNSCDFHIVRGGCYADTPPLIRSATRNWGPMAGIMPEFMTSSAGGGFRVARML
jgi:formylglycine-generating enzyme required for sulfatase activity